MRWGFHIPDWVAQSAVAVLAVTCLVGGLYMLFGSEDHWR